MSHQSNPTKPEHDHDHECVDIRHEKSFRDVLTYAGYDGFGMAQVDAWVCIAIMECICGDKYEEDPVPCTCGLDV